MELGCLIFMIKDHSRLTLQHSASQFLFSLLSDLVLFTCSISRVTAYTGVYPVS